MKLLGTTAHPMKAQNTKTKLINILIVLSSFNVTQLYHTFLTKTPSFVR